MSDILLFATMLIAGLFTYDWWRALRAYLHFGDGRTLRSFTKSVVLVSLSYSAFVRSLLLNFFPADAVGFFIVFMLYGIALCGGIVMVITWQREGV